MRRIHSEHFIAAATLLGLANAFKTQFSNPILPGFHPDPSCTFIPSEQTFYCASSSFNAFPGIPIHASKDLQTWRLVGAFSSYLPLLLPFRLCPDAHVRTTGPKCSLSAI